MQFRIKHHNLSIFRSSAEIARYTMLSHERTPPNPERRNILGTRSTRFSTDGLNSLKYKRLDLHLKMLYTHIVVDLLYTSGISPKKSYIPRILPFQNLTGNFPGVDHYINYATSIKKNLNTTSLEQNPKSHLLLVDINEYRFPITTAKCLTNQQVFIAVISAPGNFENRKMIRETWFLHITNSSCRFSFIVGL